MCILDLVIFFVLGVSRLQDQNLKYELVPISVFLLLSTQNLCSRNLNFLMVCGMDDNGVQTSYGDIEFGFYPTVAPKTVDHIFKLVRLGGYNTNHFFRVYELKAQALM